MKKIVKSIYNIVIAMIIASLADQTMSHEYNPALNISKANKDFTERANAALKLDQADLAKAHIEKAIEIIETTYGKTKPDLDKANALIVLGDIYAYHKDFEQANLAYQKSESIFNQIFANGKTDDISYLYSQLAINGANLNNALQAEYYFQLHRKTFGISHFRTIGLVENLTLKNMQTK